MSELNFAPMIERLERNQQYQVDELINCRVELAGIVGVLTDLKAQPHPLSESVIDMLLGRIEPLLAKPLYPEAKA